MGITAKITRPYYLKWLNSWKDKDIIKVVSGIRRAGKTTLLELFREQLANDGIPQKNIKIGRASCRERVCLSV